MSDQNYPARGCVSEDGKLYADTDGEVYEKRLGFGKYNRGKCAVCKYNRDGSCIATPPEGCGWELIEGSYVPSPDELKAAEAVRAGINECLKQSLNGRCTSCISFQIKSCPLRNYLRDVLLDGKAYEVGE